MRGTVSSANTADLSDPDAMAGTGEEVHRFPPRTADLDDGPAACGGREHGEGNGGTQVVRGLGEPGQRLDLGRQPGRERCDRERGSWTWAPSGVGGSHSGSLIRLPSLS